MKTVVPKYIYDLIESGENQTLDFKFEISDASKIAKTLVAFSNTNGGRLLVGVKDNGALAGVRSHEEIFMIESAAKIYSKNKIQFEVIPWNISGKQILEVIIEEGQQKPYFAKDIDNKWKAYVRVADQNFLANNVLVRYWKEKNKRSVKIQYSRKEQFLLDYLKDYEDITLDEFAGFVQISKSIAEDILVDFLILDIIKMRITEKGIFYFYNEEQQ